ncbi:MAG: PAS domain S-box protein [Betaproteobacteria bacterium]
MSDPALQFALRANDAALLRAQEMARLSHVIAGAGGIFEAWSESFPLLVGLEDRTMPRSTDAWLDLVHPEDRTNLRLKALRAGAAGKRADVVYRARHANGHWVVVRQSMEPQSDHADSDGVRRWFHTFQDITGQAGTEAHHWESQPLLQALVDSTSDFVFAKDLAGRYLLFNAAAAKVTGKDVDAVIGRDDNFVFPSKQAAQIRKDDIELCAAGKTVTEEIAIVVAGGEQQVHLTTKGPLRNADGETIGMFGIARDITGRKRAEAEALRDAETRAEIVIVQQAMTSDTLEPQQLMDLVAHHAQALTRADGATVELVADRECMVRAATGTMREFAGGRFQRSTSLSGAAVQHGELLICDDTDTDRRVDRDLCAKTGMRSLVVAPFQANPQSFGVLKVIAMRPGAFVQRDIDNLQILAESLGAALQRHYAVTRLQASEAQYRLLFANNPHPMWVYDIASLRFLAVNQSAVEKYGYTEQEFLAMTIVDLRPKVDIPALMESLRAASPDSKHFGQWRHVHKDGAIIDVEISSDAISFNGTPARLVLANDISKRLQAEREHEKLEAQLRESQKMEAVGTLAGGIAHDFNNILASILGNATLAQEDTAANPLAQESLREIDRAAKRGRELVRQILAFSRREPTLRHAIDLCPIVEESARLLRSTLPPKISLDAKCEAGLPLVLADETQIGQIILNLGTNATYAMKGMVGLVTIRVSKVVLDAVSASVNPDLRPGTYVLLSVQDIGQGMAPATLARIFEPFFTTKPVGEGTGLGLAVVHGIMHDHDGVIVIQSEPNRGTRFELYFPETKVQSRPAKGVCATSQGAGGSGQHVLYIDDDSGMLFLVKRLLERQGYRISTFSDAFTALETLRAAPAEFDLVITDFNMPTLSGLDVARECRAIAPGLPVAIASGYITDELRSQAENAGVRELLFKPNSVSEFCTAVQRMLANAGRDASPENHQAAAHDSVAR